MSCNCLMLLKRQMWRSPRRWIATTRLKEGGPWPLPVQGEDQLPTNIMQLHQHQQKNVLGELQLEVLEAENLPCPQISLGRVDPFVVLLHESWSARTSTVWNTANPRWGATSAARLSASHHLRIFDNLLGRGG